MQADTIEPAPTLPNPMVTFRIRPLKDQCDQIVESDFWSRWRQAVVVAHFRARDAETLSREIGTSRLTCRTVLQTKGKGVVLCAWLTACETLREKRSSRSSCRKRPTLLLNAISPAS